MAMSANGYIARENGKEDFLSHENWKTFIELAKKYGNFIYGRKTYEAVRAWGNEYLEDLKAIKKKIVISQAPDFQAENGFSLAKSPQEAVSLLQSEGFDTALLSGGATVNSAFVKSGLLDEIIFNIEPFVLGKGTPVFSPEDLELKLQFLNFNRLNNGILQLSYKIL